MHATELIFIISIFSFTQWDSDKEVLFCLFEFIWISIIYFLVIQKLTDQVAALELRVTKLEGGSSGNISYIVFV